jgi:hypothetical protein
MCAIYNYVQGRYAKYCTYMDLKSSYAFVANTVILLIL